MKIIIATPFYEIKGYSPYISSLMNTVKGLNELGMEYSYYELSGDSYVDRAKNTIANRFMQSDYTHLFMIDSDLAWDVAGFMRIIKDAKYFDVVGGAFPNKNNWNSYGAILRTDKGGFPVGHDRDGIRVLDALAIPGGFVMYSKKAFKMVQGSVNTYVDDKSGDKKGTEFYEYFRCDVVDKQRMGEDVYFQNKFRQAGGRVMLEPNIHFSHYGVKGWNGNFHEYLISQPKVEGVKKDGNA